MDIFNHKKLADLKYKVICLEEEIDELKYIIQNKGYVVPEVKTLYFINDDKFIFNRHFTSVTNFMNANNIEIVSVSLDKRNREFTIKYRLPDNILSADFEYLQQRNYDALTYKSQFSVKYK